VRIALANLDANHVLAVSQQTPDFTLSVDQSAKAPLTEEQIAIATLAFANGATIYVRGSVRAPKLAPLPPSFPKIELVSAKAIQADDRSFTKELLALAMSDPEAAARQLIPNGNIGFTAASRVIRRIKGGLSISYYEDFPTTEHLVTTGTMFFLDPSRDFQKRLCRCALPICSLFFFEIRGSGLPQRKYCCKAHREDAHTLGAAARAARRRAGVLIRKPAGSK
jgi:hypothetical protein